MPAVFLNLDPATCPRTYPSTKAGLCHGCGTSHASIPRAADQPGYWRFSTSSEDAPRDVVFFTASAYRAPELARRYIGRDVPNAWTLDDVGDERPIECVVYPDPELVGR